MRAAVSLQVAETYLAERYVALEFFYEHADSIALRRR